MLTSVPPTLICPPASKWEAESWGWEKPRPATPQPVCGGAGSDPGVHALATAPLPSDILPELPKPWPPSGQPSVREPTLLPLSSTAQPLFSRCGSALLSVLQACHCPFHLRAFARPSLCLEGSLPGPSRSQQLSKVSLSSSGKPLPSPRTSSPTSTAPALAGLFYFPLGACYYLVFVQLCIVCLPTGMQAHGQGSGSSAIPTMRSGLG